MIYVPLSWAHVNNSCSSGNVSQDHEMFLMVWLCHELYLTKQTMTRVRKESSAITKFCGK